MPTQPGNQLSASRELRLLRHRQPPAPRKINLRNPLPPTLLLFVEQTVQTGGALYVAWQTASQGTRSAIATRRQLFQGEKQHLYRLRSWVVVNGEAQVLVTPVGSLDEIVGELWRGASRPLRTRWVSGRACARLSRAIEREPVRLGLIGRPEQWPHSSAAAE